MSSPGCQQKSEQREQSLKPHPWPVLPALGCVREPGWAVGKAERDRPREKRQELLGWEGRGGHVWVGAKKGLISHSLSYRPGGGEGWGASV